MIWLSVNRDFFMWNLLRKRYEKVLPLSTANLWGDYRLPLWQGAISICILPETREGSGMSAPG